MTTFPVSLTDTRVPTLMWAPEADLEQNVKDQLRSIGELPWVRGVRVMPDVHLGMGATVGSVIAMEHAVSPAAVGVDIGCGVAAVRTNLTASDLPDSLAAIRSSFERTVPVGFNAHKHTVNPSELRMDHTLVDGLWSEFWDLTHTKRSKDRTKVQRQLGTLGGGNHFIELCLDDADRLWLTLHSGSRNIGKQLAEHHISIAKTLAHNADLGNRDLAVFVAGTKEMDAYRHDLHWAQRYAAASRAVMVALLQDQLRHYFPHIEFMDEVNVHHNYVAEEEIAGRPMLVTRKGAIRAGRGDRALIPGSMGTGSYVVRGLGNADAFNSASHGAGRRMSRTQAKKQFTVDDLIAQTRGVESRKDAGVLDELPAAYKDIDEVITAQKDLVEVEARLRTILCVKG